MMKRGTLKDRVLQFFFLNERQGVYVNELARRLEADPKNVHRVLLRLEKDGILVSDFRGNLRFFSSNTGDSIYKAHKAIFRKVAGVEAILKKVLAGIAGLEKVWIFGSYAKGEFTHESDIDLLCVGCHVTLDVERKLRVCSRDIGREINTVHMTSMEFREKKKGTFLKSIFSGNVIEIL